MTTPHPAANALGGLDPRHVKLAGKFLASQGRGGDSLLVHVGPREARVLKALGGAGTRNPVTGLLEYYGSDVGGPDTSDSAGAEVGGGAGARADADAHAGGYGGGGHGANEGGGIRGQNSGAPAPMGGASGGYNSTSQLAIKDPITSAALKNQGTYANSSGPLGAFGKYVLGLGWVDPTQMNRKALTTGQPPPSQPNYGEDVLGLGLGIGGALTGLPLGTAYSGLKALGVIPGDFGVVDLGQWSDVHNTPPRPGGSGNGGPGQKPDPLAWQQPGASARGTSTLQALLTNMLSPS